ncbi:MAG: hypothetical protein Q8P47_02130 [Candidatus Beckwithbacteria bacterium]|nr:hypothetical protein [Candidatus Beckwithbacteria bacterium]
MITKIFVARLKKDLWRLAIFSLVTVVIWLILSTYRILNRSQVTPDIKKQLQPLTSSLELDTMDQVTQRIKTPETDWGSLGQTAPLLVVEEATQSATSSAQP